MSIGNFQEVLGQRILVGIILVGRLGVQPPQLLLISIYLSIYISIYLSIYLSVSLSLSLYIYIYIYIYIYLHTHMHTLIIMARAYL